jgi:hypothetical protein
MMTGTSAVLSEGFHGVSRCLQENIEIILLIRSRTLAFTLFLPHANILSEMLTVSSNR